MANRYKVNHKNSFVITGHCGKVIQDKPQDKGRENLFLGTVEKDTPLEYPISKTSTKEFVEIGQNTSRPVNSNEQHLDDLGYTNPNLHRRIDVTLPKDVKELVPRKYRLEIDHYNSYRNVEVTTHLDYTDVDKYSDDERNYSEIEYRFANYEKKEIP